MKKVYSNNQEEYCHDSAEEAGEALWNFSESKVGDIIIVWEGETVRHYAESFVPNMADALTEAAYDEVGEWSDGWEFSKEEAQSLQAAVEKTVEEWADANKMQPDFYSVTDVKEIKVRFVNEEGKCEVVEEVTQ